MYVIIYAYAPLPRVIGRHNRRGTTTKIMKGDIIMESVLPIWQEFCTTFAVRALILFGIIGLIVIIGQIVKNMIL